MAVALPLSASQGGDQSYFTFDDGGTIVRQGQDGQEINGRMNLPLFPGDEVITDRRGRAEIHLADGNVLALDRSTDVVLRTILDAYDTDAQETVIELRYGHVALQRTDLSREALRLDTQNASYAASEPAVYAVENESGQSDHIMVFTGQIEVRTPVRTTVMGEGDEGRVDSNGLYGLVSQRDDADEFERWFIRRSERYSSSESAYLDQPLAYSDSNLQEYGSWTFVSSIGTWGWRPYVGTGWRPYYYGNWMYGPNGCLVWVSDEPWGWVPYHYGRWAYDPVYGWVWIPGYTYSPAWVYWIYGPGFFGWAPAGWFDCYRPYYGWAYQPYRRAGFDFGFGFYGRVRLNEIDLRPWTFVSPNNIVSTRVDRAALTTDIIRQRLLRDPRNDFATVSGTPARFSRSEIKDPAAAINTIARRGIGGGTGREGSGPATDLTPFFRRDPELPNNVRERIVHSGTPAVVAPTIRGGIAAAPPRVTPTGVPAPGTPGTLEGRIPARGDKDTSGGIDRGAGGRTPVTGGQPVTPQFTPPPANVQPRSTPPPAPNWRERVERPAPQAPVNRGATPPPPRDESWRTRATGRRGEQPAPSAVPRDRAPVHYTPADPGSDIPRRIIDRIGGARIYTEPSPPPPPRIERSSPPPPPERSSSPPPSSSHSSGRGGGSGRRH